LNHRSGSGRIGLVVHGEVLILHGAGLPRIGRLQDEKSKRRRSESQLPSRQLDDARSNGNCGGANRQRRRHDEIDLTDEGAYDSPACAGYQHLIRRLPKAPERRNERSWRPALLRAKARAVNHNGGARWRRRRTRKASHSRPHLRIEAREEVCRARPQDMSGLKEGPSGMPEGAQINRVEYWPVR